MALERITADEINISLQYYQNLYKDCLTNHSQGNYFNTFMHGLLSNLDRKTIKPIALAFMVETAVRGFQQFFKRSKLQDDTLLERYQDTLSKAVSSSEGMLCVDGSDFVKKGSDSVGVLRQYCGRLGKTEHCQAGVFLSCAPELGYGIVDRKLYLPEARNIAAHNYGEMDIEILWETATNDVPLLRNYCEKILGGYKFHRGIFGG